MVSGVGSRAILFYYHQHTTNQVAVEVVVVAPGGVKMLRAASYALFAAQVVAYYTTIT